ncbi:PREDICTED: uncharacterized protein LOC109162013 [Ipomoea nil]|uniref:uncharacterized protein LOC109162013 n=1 Tax=Ipomoea nil TaxID=35883 RepID=UPI000900D4BD|nr:PREDICTED: uncharacterized protein LOC109162013 [Ipomoea nil]
MEFPELSLSLAASNFNGDNAADSDQDIRLPMKRKIQSGGGGSVDLHQPWMEPLPVDWEQCLDLQSGRMYYVNRKTMKKTWEWPKEQKQAQLNLELNISTSGAHSYEDRHHKKHQHPSSPPSNGAGGENMIALPCSNCHLLVIVSQTSPSCPNCKFVQYSAAGNRSPAKPFHSGLSLFN